MKHGHKLACSAQGPLQICTRGTSFCCQIKLQQLSWRVSDSNKFFFGSCTFCAFNPWRVNLFLDKRRLLFMITFLTRKMGLNFFFAFTLKFMCVNISTFHWPRSKSYHRRQFTSIKGDNECKRQFTPIVGDNECFPSMWINLNRTTITINDADKRVKLGDRNSLWLEVAEGLTQRKKTISQNLRALKLWEEKMSQRYQWRIHIERFHVRPIWTICL